MLNTKYQQAIISLKQRMNALSYFENNALNNATAVIEAANTKFSQGAINYLEYTIVVNQAIAVRSDYYDAVKNLNEIIFEIKYLTK